MKKTLLFLSLFAVGNGLVVSQAQAGIWDKVKPTLKITAGTGFAGVAAFCAYVAKEAYPKAQAFSLGDAMANMVSASICVPSAVAAISSTVAAVMLINSGINDIQELRNQAE